MPRRRFLTVPEELLEVAEFAADHYDSHGYTVRVEHRELGFPYTPAILCRRRNTTVIVEVDDHIPRGRLSEWVAFAKSTGADTRVTLVLSPGAETDGKEEDQLREIGIGLLVFDGCACVERIAGRDLALGVQLPELANLPRRVRKLLGPAYEQFNHAQWREGFEEACQAFEAEARRYLKAAIRAGRITITQRSGLLSTSGVDRLTMGQLAEVFKRIPHQNHADAVIGQTLKAVNQDRIGVVHKKALRRTESRLRSNVGRHMWALISAIKELV